MRRKNPESEVAGTAKFLHNRKKAARLSDEKKEVFDVAVTTRRPFGRSFNLAHFLEDVDWMSRSDTDVEKLVAEGESQRTQFFLEDLQRRAIEAAQPKRPRRSLKKPPSNPKATEGGEEE